MSALAMQPGAVGSFSAEMASQIGVVVGRLVNKGQLTHAYYSKPNGDITIGPSHWMMEAQLERRKPRDRWTRLKTDLSPDSAPIPPFDIYDYTLERPFENLAIWGKLALVPRKQVLELGLHKRPDLLVPVCGMGLSPFHFAHTDACFVGAQPYRWTQMHPEDYAEIAECQYCGQTMPTEQARQFHIRIMHKEDWQHEAMGKAIVDATRIATRRDGEDAQEPLDLADLPVGRQAIQMGVIGLYQCGACGRGYNNVNDLVECSASCNGIDIPLGDIELPQDAETDETGGEV